MALDFAAGQNLSAGLAVVTAAPFTFACWFNAATTSEQPLFSISDGTNASSLFLVELFSSKVGVQAATGANEALTSTTFPMGSWNHAAAVFASASSRSAYLNGGGKVTKTTTATPTGMTNTWLAKDRSSGYAGILAEAGIWNVALTDAEITALAQGALPRAIRPQSLVGYWPLYGLSSPEPDLSGGRHNMSLTGTPTQANHAPVSMFTPKRRAYPQFDVAAAPTSGLLLRRRRAAA